jgi:hypothetical protein
MIMVMMDKKAPLFSPISFCGTIIVISVTILLVELMGQCTYILHIPIFGFYMWVTLLCEIMGEIILALYIFFVHMRWWGRLVVKGVLLGF